jgi:WD40 repeat protein
VLRRPQGHPDSSHMTRQDSIRRVVANPAAPSTVTSSLRFLTHLQLFASASYDHTVKVFKSEFPLFLNDKLWDARAPSAVRTLAHPAQVEAVCFMGGGSLLASAAGATVRLWDALAARLSTQFSHSQVC